MNLELEQSGDANGPSFLGLGHTIAAIRDPRKITLGKCLSVKPSLDHLAYFNFATRADIPS